MGRRKAVWVYSAVLLNPENQQGSPEKIIRIFHIFMKLQSLYQTMIQIKSLLSQNGSTKVSDTDALWLDMTEKLEEYGYAFSIDYKAELEDFLWSLEQLKSYSLIEACVSSLKLNPEMDIDAWGEEINLALSGKAYVCTIDTDSDSYGIIIVTEKILEKISSIAESHGREIYDF